MLAELEVCRYCMLEREAPLPFTPLMMDAPLPLMLIRDAPLPFVKFDDDTFVENEGYFPRIG